MLTLGMGLAGKGAVYTYDPVGSYERAGYGCDVSSRTGVLCMLCWMFQT